MWVVMGMNVEYLQNAEYARRNVHHTHIHPLHTYNPHTHTPPIQQAAEQRRVDAATFDSSRLVDFRERIRCDIAAVLISPLVRESGRFVVTDQRIYFQPIHNILGDVVVYTHPLSAVAAVAKRLCCLRPLGMEVFLVDPGARAPGPTWDTPCAFFSFRNEHERTRCYETLMQQAALGSGIAGGGAALRDAAGVLEGSGEWLPRVTRAWRHGQLSNFDYLLFCNLAAGRSFNDLAQWPVIPWVLRDFTSAVLDLHDAVCCGFGVGGCVWVEGGWRVGWVCACWSGMTDMLMCSISCHMYV